jgi:hypothetical protein
MLVRCMRSGRLAVLTGRAYRRIILLYAKDDFVGSNRIGALRGEFTGGGTRPGE